MTFSDGVLNNRDCGYQHRRFYRCKRIRLRCFYYGYTVCKRRVFEDTGSSLDSWPYSVPDCTFGHSLIPRPVPPRLTRAGSFGSDPLLSGWMAMTTGERYSLNAIHCTAFQVCTEYGNILPKFIGCRSHQPFSSCSICSFSSAVYFFQINKDLFCFFFTWPAFGYDLFDCESCLVYCVENTFPAAFAVAHSPGVVEQYSELHIQAFGYTVIETASFVCHE